MSLKRTLITIAVLLGMIGCPSTIAKKIEEHDSRVATVQPADLELKLNEVRNERNSDFIDIMIGYFSAEQQTRERVLQYGNKIENNMAVFADDTRKYGIAKALDILQDPSAREILSFEYTLRQNTPNPFNPNTAITYSIKEPGNVSLKIYNLLGQEIKTVVNEQKQAGEYQAKWDGKDTLGRQVSSGVYLYVLQANDFSATKKMLFVK